MARTGAKVLIGAGESGSGKEAVARSHRRRQPRSNMPFVPVNCAGIPGTLAVSQFPAEARLSASVSSSTGTSQRVPGKAVRTVNMRNHGVERLVLIACAFAVLAAGQRTVGAQVSTHAAAVAAAPTAPKPGATVAPPADYVIGPDDQLSIVFWRDKDMSADVVVRPDGKISLPLLNEVQAAGYTPEQLRTQLVEAASKYVEQPNATVVVKEIHSRNAYITGKVARSGTYTVTVGMNVMQLIALAGGLLEYADEKNIVVIRNEGGRQQYHQFNYKDVVNQKRPQQNIALRPGDTVVVP